MWGWSDPWWVTAHGRFKNGVVFEIANGFVYGQMARDKTENCGLEVIGTLGVVRMAHDFRDVEIDYRGVETTTRKTGPYGGKKLDVLCENFARSLDAGRALGLPLARDSVIASQVAQEMLDFATQDDPPVIGSPDDLQRILAHRAGLRRRPEATHPSVLI
jgi:myo-inositol 2-dehydrogenase/D-chiro-inositol 1-dehydrogenase